jgi:nucleoside-diphosphate-sugar epimerase
MPHFPITAEQVLRLKEDKVFDIKDAVATLGYRPRGFDEGISHEIDEMCQANLLPR